MVLIIVPIIVYFALFLVITRLVLSLFRSPLFLGIIYLRDGTYSRGNSSNSSNNITSVAARLEVVLEEKSK